MTSGRRSPRTRCGGANITFEDYVWIMIVMMSHICIWTPYLRLLWTRLVAKDSYLCTYARRYVATGNKMFRSLEASDRLRLP